MKTFATRIGIFLGSSALGLWLTSLLVDGFHLSLGGFLTAVLVFTVAQAALTPLVSKLAHRYADAFIGGVGVVSTFLALLIATLLSSGLRLTGGLTTWIASVVLVWLLTALATWALPKFLLKDRPAAD
ncbi:hypothetical protein [Cellulomonas sp. NPDC089187]|uniref:hypothetical protein n=1 Tax=Cellulomonas sp. NPDC089187 TaxID=3154970 RepID=UPI00342A6D94